MANLNVKYKGKMYNLRTFVVPGSGPSLLGRNWLESLPINLFANCDQIKLTDLNQKFFELFKPGLDILKLYIKQNCTLRFMKAKSVPLMILKKVETEPDRMVATSVIKPVDFFRTGFPYRPIFKEK